jgi:DNA-binding NtrC family response regulator
LIHLAVSGAEHHEPLKVLVVSADSQQVQELGDALRRRGCEPLEATSFEAARRLWNAEHPPMLIADVRLGQFNGLQLLIRARADRPDLAAVITSAAPDAVLQAETRRFGAAFLVKSVTPDEVCATVLRLLPHSFLFSSHPAALSLEPAPDRRTGQRRRRDTPGYAPERRVADRRAKIEKLD